MSRSISQGVFDMKSGFEALGGGEKTRAQVAIGCIVASWTSEGKRAKHEPMCVTRCARMLFCLFVCMEEGEGEGDERM